MNARVKDVVGGEPSGGLDYRVVAPSTDNLVDSAAHTDSHRSDLCNSVATNSVLQKSARTI